MSEAQDSTEYNEHPVLQQQIILAIICYVLVHMHHIST